MRAVFVNQCHPDTPHVCAVRMREFAAAMARRGHRVVLLTEQLGPREMGAPLDSLEQRLENHHWRTPLHVDCPRQPALMLDRLHAGRLALVARKAVVAAAFVFRGGVFAHWEAGSRATGAVLARAFRPDIVWGSFGCTDVWNVAKRIAAKAGCPWAADIKDNWEVFIPFGLRALLARRYRGAAEFTALSAGHAEAAEARFGAAATVIHSGFPHQAVSHRATGGGGTFRIVAGGSIYDGRGFALIIAAIREWLAGRDAPGRVEFRYAGNEHLRVAELAAPLQGLCEITVGSYLAPAEFQSMLAGASVIVYARNVRMAQHQKFIEYLATGRPVLCLPHETGEFRTLAQSVDGPFFSCDSTADVMAALSTIAAGDVPALDRDRLEEYSWDRQAELLERVFQPIMP